MKEWSADLAFEGVKTTDDRLIERDALTWPRLPLSLMKLESGGSVLCGQINRIERDTDHDVEGNPLPPGVVAIRGYGVADIDRKHHVAVDLRLVEGTHAEDVFTIRAGEIMAATIIVHPAFPNAQIIPGSERI